MIGGTGPGPAPEVPFLVRSLPAAPVLTVSFETSVTLPIGPCRWAVKSIGITCVNLQTRRQDLLLFLKLLLLLK